MVCFIDFSNAQLLPWKSGGTLDGNASANTNRELPAVDRAHSLLWHTKKIEACKFAGNNRTWTQARVGPKTRRRTPNRVSYRASLIFLTRASGEQKDEFRWKCILAFISWDARKPCISYGDKASQMCNFQKHVWWNVYVIFTTECWKNLGVMLIMVSWFVLKVAQSWLWNSMSVRVDGTASK